MGEDWPIPAARLNGDWKVVMVKLGGETPPEMTTAAAYSATTSHLASSSLTVSREFNSRRELVSGRLCRNYSELVCLFLIR